MPVSIDQIDAVVRAPESGAAAAAAAGTSSSPSAPEADRRKWSEQLQREAVRAARVHAD